MRKLKLALSSLLMMMAVFAFAERGKITVLYTNDVHTYIANTVKNSEGKKVPGISYGSVAAMKKDLEAKGENVALVDAGDHIQGTAYGAMDSGKSIIRFMNEAGYQVATLGNHEFDYGTARAFEVMKEAKFPYVSCNFYRTKNSKLVLPAFKILKFGKTKVAFVGISTPETYTKSTPAYFMDSEQKNFIYKFWAGTDGKELYNAVQDAIDKASKKADYVIALGHIGDDPSSSPWTSVEIIQNTKGLDAFIDGHSHSTVPMKIVKDAAGKDVVLSQTGSFFAAVGKMTLDGDEIKTELVTKYENSDEKVDGLVKEWAKKVDDSLNEVIAVADSNLYITNPENPKERLIRKQETNLGDLIPDSVYWYFNEIEGLNCDIGIGNGGGIRVDTPAGDFTYNSAKKIQPFGNVICLVELKGQDILDALEWCSRSAGKGECGGFLHVAGLKYTIDTSIEPTLTSTPEGMWQAGPTGDYRVKDVQVYNKKNGEYEPLDLEKTYTVGGINYTLRSSGDGCAMFAKAKLVKDYIGEDYLITCAYVKAFGGKDEKGLPHITTKNSPLSSYKNYLLDYENPNGSGRITLK